MCTRFRCVYDRVQKLYQEWPKSEAVQKQFEFEWITSMQVKLDSILSMEKLHPDECGHGFIKLNYSKDLKHYLKDFDPAKCIKKVSKMPPVDKDFIHMEVLKKLQIKDYCNYDNPLIIDDEWLHDLSQNVLNRKYSVEFLLQYLKKNYCVIYDDKYFYLF